MVTGGDFLRGIVDFISLIVLGLAGIVVGIFEGVFKCSLSYFKGIKYSFNKLYSIKAERDFDEPAKEKYFFYKQYEDLLNTYRSAKSINDGNILLLRSELKQDSYFSSARIGSAQIAISIVGIVFNIICFSIHLFAITIISIPVYLFYGIVVSIEKIKFNRCKISTICPHCHNKFNIPSYICPRCGQTHKMLIPGPYGIIRRKCKCGEVLPTTNFSRRFKLKAVCPVCSENIKSRESTPICIPIIGGKSVGKTSYMYSFVDTLINDISKEKKWNIRFLNENEEENFNRNLALLKKGNSIEKTNRLGTDAYNIFISSDKFSSEKLLYMYDIDGENFNSRTAIRRQNYYKHINGLILIIDSLSIINGESRIKGKDESININSNSINVDDLIDRFILGLREIRQISLNKLIDIPVVVIINKMELFDYKGDVIDFLKLIEQEKIIRKFEHNFENYKFFLGSVLEDSEKEVEKSIKWILSQANKELK